MTKLVALTAASVLALATSACGNDADAPSEAQIDETALDGGLSANDATQYPVTTAGTYEGGGVTMTLSEDGSFLERNGDATREGTWEYDTIRGTCLTDQGSDQEQCYNMGEVQDDGTVSVTGPDGTTTTMTKVS
ncbi:hypothetical protein [Aurantiacibacter spongiae]|uniref:Uncharacterized protein n=1 Tax=Aurantiacibacter spongiae TaxID=2488860 RepID=A0A3N5CPU5_9SPHN|nr:hypothetical protein [Aurantiacibacter spongiae]RPF70386.1 hypothetical protein EG799_01130 [Aurantiacibacter spongiae]